MGATVVHSLSDIPEGFVRLARFHKAHRLDVESRKAFDRGRRKGKIGEFKLISKWCSKRRNYATFINETEALDFVAAERPVVAEVVHREVMNFAQTEGLVLSEEVSLLRDEVARLRSIVGELAGLRKATEDMVSAAVSLLAERGLAT